MEESQINIGATYTAKSPLLSHPFKGKIINKLEHSVIIEILTYDSDDGNVAKDLQYKTVVSYSSILD